MRRVLIIAGSDPSGGAGIQADIKTATASGVFATTAITALTVQNTQGVTDILDIRPDFVIAQAKAVLDDIGADAIKIGMLHRCEVIEAIAELLADYLAIPVVLDPVMVATSGDQLLEAEALKALTAMIKQCKNPLYLTPNIPEAELLSGGSIASLDAMETAGKELLKDYNLTGLFMKGGHLQDKRCTDLLLTQTETLRMTSPRLQTRHTHGTGCTLATALACQLACGATAGDAAQAAHTYVHQAIIHAPELGHGYGPLNHMHNLLAN